jgi:hypothetical protein
MSLLIKLASLKFIFVLPILILWMNQEMFAYEPTIGCHERTALREGWKFSIDPDDAYINKNPSVIQTEFDDSTWESVNIPHTINLLSNTANKDYSGIVWYRKRIEIPGQFQDGFTFIEFLGSYLITDAWLDGEYIGRHNGGYTGFKFDISEFSQVNKAHTLVVRCDSTKREKQAPGVMFIWFPYTGLYREVYIAHYPDVFPEKVFIDTTQDQLKGTVSILTKWKMKNSSDKSKIEVKYLIEKKGTLYNSIEFPLSLTERGDLVSRNILYISNPTLWSVDNPVLYDLRIEYKFEDKLYNKVERFGLRNITTEGKKILLNGQEIKFSGLALFEDSQKNGPFFNRDERLKDLEYLKSIGANMLRLGHYPQHPEMLSLCDELGIIIYEEIPVWQFTVKDSELDEYIQEWAKPQLDELIERDYNHPSLCFVGVANEIRDNKKYLDIMLPYAKKIAPTRLITYTSDSFGEDRETFENVDVISKNFHFGWFHSESPYDIKKAIDDLSKIDRNKPFFISEIGAMSIPDLNAPISTDVRFTEEYHYKVLYTAMNNIISNLDSLSGFCIWTLYDFRSQAKVASSGIYDFNSKPRLILSLVKRELASKINLSVLDNNSYYEYKTPIDLKLSIYPLNKDIQNATHLFYRIVDKDGQWNSSKISLKEFELTRSTGEFNFKLDIPEKVEGLNFIDFELKNDRNEVIAKNLYYFDVKIQTAPSTIKINIIDGNNVPLKDVKINLDNDLIDYTDFYGWSTFIYFEKQCRITMSKKGFREVSFNLDIREGKTMYKVVILKRAIDD